MMKNVVKKRVQVIAAAILFAFVMSVSEKEAFAAGTVSVTADKSSVGVAETVTVSVQTSEPEDASVAPEITITYDTAYLSFESCDVDYGGGGGGLITITGQQANITFTAAATGTASVSAEAVIDEDGNNPATGAASITVTGAANENLSSDATLRALSMNPGTMIPEFSPEVTDYTITVEKSVTDITVSGGVTDEAAQITAASGFKNLKEGTNQAVITVTAADGSTLTYHFTIQRGEEAGAEEETQTEEEAPQETAPQEAGSLEFTVGETVYTVSEAFGNDVLLQGCSKASSSYNGHEIDAARFDAAQLLLVYAQSEADGSGEFFIYDEKNPPSQPFIQLMGNENRFIVPLQPEEEVPDGFVEENMQWNTLYLPAFTLADASVDNADSYFLLYAVNSEGAKGFYLYDAFEGTYQRFLSYATAASAGGTAGNSQRATIFICALIFLLVCAIMTIVNLIIRNRELVQEQEDSEGEARAQEKEKPAVRKRQTRKRNAIEKSTSEKKASAERKAAAQKRQAEKKAEKKAAEAEQTAEQKPAQEKKTARRVITPQAAETASQPSAKKEETPAVKKVVTPQGVTYTTGEIPITVVQPPKPTARAQKSVPIFTLERQPVPLTREAPPDELDDDFEFEFISIDKE